MYYTFAIMLILLILVFILYKLNNVIHRIDKSILVTPVNGNIPKIIIQTWKSDTVPQRYIELIETIKNNNPDYEYLFFTDQDIEDFLKSHYPKYYKTYLSLPIKIQKIDFFRYVAVYHYGGFYMDLDMNGLKSFDSLLHFNCVFPVDEYISKHLCKVARYKPFCERGQKLLLGQYAFAAAPKHPFIKKIIDTIHANIHKYIRTVNFDSDEYVYSSTGPDFVTDVYLNYNNKNDITILDNGKRQYFGDYARHHYFGTWK